MHSTPLRRRSADRRPTRRRSRTMRAVRAAAALAVTAAVAGLTSPTATAATFSEQDYYCDQLQRYHESGGREGAAFNVYSAGDCTNYLVSLNAFLPGGKLYDLYTGQDIPALGSFDKNFVFWAPQTPTSAASVKNTQWAYCATPHALGTVCPVTDITFDNAYRVGEVISGPVTVRVGTDGTFMGMFCGNAGSFSGTAEGPIPRITGTKYEDVNGDGQRDPDEPGVGGFVIRLARDGQPVAETTTDAAGAYTFVLNANVDERFQPGTYTLTEVARDGWTQSAAPAPVSIGVGKGGSVVDDGTVVRAVDRTFAGNDFGNYRPATITGTKVEDLDADNSPEGDPGLAGWTITATRAGGGGGAIGTTGTDGGYRLAGLRPGSYTVTETGQPGWFQSFPAAGTHTVTVRSGQIASDVTFANWRPGVVTGRKYQDLDVDGVGTGDPGKPGWSIQLSGTTTPGPVTPIWRTTDADGGYRYQGLRPGQYTVAEASQAGWRQSAPSSGSYPVRLRSGQTVPDLDFGNVCLGGTDITVRDISTNTDRTGTTIRIEQISVPGVLRNEPALPLTNTNQFFTDLLPGTYRVVVFLDPDVYTTDPDVQVVDGRWAIVKTITVGQCARTPLTVTVFTRSHGKVTGGMKGTVDVGFGTSGFVFMTRDGVAAGHLEYNDHVVPFQLNTSDIRAIYVNPTETQAWVWGFVDYRGERLLFELVLYDNGEPGSNDRYVLKVLDRYTIGEGRTIVGGNIQIHD